MVCGVVQLLDGIEIVYIVFVGVVVEVEFVINVVLCDIKFVNIVGKLMKWVDIVVKLIGIQNYGIDFKIEGIVYVIVKMNFCQGGVLNGFDVIEVEGMIGVQKVMEIIGGVVVVVNNMWIVIQVVNLIVFDWGLVFYFYEQFEYWQVLLNIFDDDYLNGEVCVVGDVDVVEGEEVVVEYWLFYVVYVLLELFSVIILVMDDCVDIWIGYQIQMFVESMVVGIIGYDVENVYLYN